MKKILFLNLAWMFFLNACASLTLNKESNSLDDLFNKTWVTEEVKEATPSFPFKSYQKNAFKFSSENLTVTSLCRFQNNKGEEVKSFFVSGTEIIHLDKEQSEFSLIEKISTMETEKAPQKRQIRPGMNSFFMCHAQFNKGKYRIAINQVTQSLELTPLSASLVLKAQ